MSKLVVHVVQVETPKMTYELVTKPTTVTAEEIEADARSRYPEGTIKATRTFDPDAYAFLAMMAENQDLSVSELLELTEGDTGPMEEPQGEEEQTA